MPDHRIGRLWAGPKESAENSLLRAYVDKFEEPELVQQAVKLIRELNLHSLPENPAYEDLEFNETPKVVVFQEFARKHRLGLAIYIMQRDKEGLMTTRVNIRQFIGRDINTIDSTRVVHALPEYIKCILVRTPPRPRPSTP